MADKKDFYQVLGVAKGASDTEIKSAYRKLARQHHPDIDKSAGAAERFKEVSEAYQVLSDPQKRKSYDQFGHAAFQGGMGGGAGYDPFAGFRGGAYSSGGAYDFSGFEDPFSLFETIFGGMAGQGFGGFRRRPTYQLELTFDEAVHGTSKDIEVEVQTERDKPAKRERMNIKIPAGVDDGTRMRFSDIDIIFRVRRSSDFIRQDYNIITETTLGIPQLVLGETIEVKTIHGKVKVKVPAGTEPGSLIRIKDKGIPYVKGNGRGDHFVRVKIDMPKNVSGKEKKLYQELAEMRAKKKGWF